jgi:hypothetical protein
MQHTYCLRKSPRSQNGQRLYAVSAQASAKLESLRRWPNCRSHCGKSRWPASLPIPAIRRRGPRSLPLLRLSSARTAYLSSICLRRACTRRQVRDHCSLLMCVPRSHMPSQFAMAAAYSFSLLSSVDVAAPEGAARTACPDAAPALSETIRSVLTADNRGVRSTKDTLH